MTAEWHHRAACREAEAGMFFPRLEAADDYTRAREYCAYCPVRDACLEEAMTVERGLARSARFGMWGGLSPEERHNLRRVRRRAAA